jgi:hypothetical protein
MFKYFLNLLLRSKTNFFFFLIKNFFYLQLFLLKKFGMNASQL